MLSISEVAYEPAQANASKSVMRNFIKENIMTNSIQCLGTVQKYTSRTALPRQKEVMTIFEFLRYGTKTKCCLIYPIFNKKFTLFDVWVCQLKVFNIITTFGLGQ